MATPFEVHSDIDTDTFTAYSDALQAAALATTRLAATSLPADLSFHRSVDSALARDLDAFSDRVLVLVNNLVHAASGTPSRMREEEDVMDEFVRSVVDPMEGMLESTDGALDVFLGKRKDPAIHVPAVPVDPHKKPKKPPIHGRLDPALTHASHIPKPQLLFKYTPSNTDESPYIPATLIPHKWCAKVPLGYVFHDERLEKDPGEVREDEDEERRKCTLHPYYYELTHPSYPNHVFETPTKPSLPPSLDIHSASHPLTFVSTPKNLLSMARTISSETELAVDLEHHSYRSYSGFLALMQISTRQADFVVDLLEPEIREGLRQAKGKTVEESEEVRLASEAGQIIARVFADPSVIKVFHGAESDIVWLQQDFNIFVVGLFDTYHASKLLEFSKFSLAYLLETYCDFIPDKRYQLADWRIRPLPAEMLMYARSDTHFLLHTYDMLRRALIDRSSNDSATAHTGPLMNAKQARHSCDLIHTVLTRSARTALRLYETEVYDAESGRGSGGWDTLARKWNKVGLVDSPALQVQGSQAAVYRAVHRWREDIARAEDESTRYVLPTHHLFLLAERIPTTVSELLSLFAGPGGVGRGVSPVLKRRTGELVAVITNATETTRSTSGPRTSAKDRREGTEVVILTAVEGQRAMNRAVPLSSATKPTYESRLWTTTPSPASDAIFSRSRSSLFGVGIAGELAQKKGITSRSSPDAEKTYLARESMLFGSMLAESTTAPSFRTTRSTFAHAKVSGESAELFKDLMEKIHKTLVIAPVVSVLLDVASMQASLSGVAVDATNKNNSPSPEASDIPPGPAGQIEIPFIPAYKRQTLFVPQSYEPGEDSIVIGQAGTRQRKRKREKAKTTQSKSGTQSGGAETSTRTADHDQEVEVFDYSSVPNLLDGENKNGDTRGLHEEGESRKKKQRRGKATKKYFQDLASSNTATFVRHRETNEKLGVVIKLTRLDEIIYMSFYHALTQPFWPNFHGVLANCILDNVQARQAWANM